MRLPRPWLALTWLILIPCVGRTAEAPVLTADELVQLDKENAMWRAIRADLDVPANLALLRKLGHNEQDLAWFESKLELVWQLPGGKGLGILSEETRDKIAEVERDLVTHYRNTRRFEETGVRPVTGPLYSKRELNRLWRRAMMRALSYEEMRDYGLARSDEAKRVDQLTQGLELTSIEQRELIRMAREFADGSSTFGLPRPVMRTFDTSQLDYYDSIRDLLGEDRFVVYLERANEEFLSLRRSPAGKAPTAAQLDLFWLRLRTRIALREKPLSPRERQEVAAEAREKATRILGQTIFAEYAGAESGQWLFPL